MNTPVTNFEALVGQARDCGLTQTFATAYEVNKALDEADCCGGGGEPLAIVGTAGLSDVILAYSTSEIEQGDKIIKLFTSVSELNYISEDRFTKYFYGPIPPDVVNFSCTKKTDGVFDVSNIKTLNITAPVGATGDVALTGINVENINIYEYPEIELLHLQGTKTLSVLNATTVGQIRLTRCSQQVLDNIPKQTAGVFMGGFNLWVDEPLEEPVKLNVDEITGGSAFTKHNIHLSKLTQSPEFTGTISASTFNNLEFKLTTSLKEIPELILPNNVFTGTPVFSVQAGKVRMADDTKNGVIKFYDYIGSDSSLSIVNASSIFTFNNKTSSIRELILPDNVTGLTLEGYVANYTLPSTLSALRLNLDANTAISVPVLTIPSSVKSLSYSHTYGLEPIKELDLQQVTQVTALTLLSYHGPISINQSTSVVLNISGLTEELYITPNTLRATTQKINCSLLNSTSLDNIIEGLMSTTSVVYCYLSKSLSQLTDDQIIRALNKGWFLVF